MTRPGPDSRRRWAILAAAFAVRMAAIYWTGANAVAFGDARDYLETARTICEERAYPDRGNLPFFRAPLLPFFIAATTLCDPERIVRVKVALALCDSVTALLVGEIAWLLFASPRTAVFAALLAAVNPFFIAGVCDVRTEPLSMLFLTCGVWLFLGTVRTGHGARALLAGVGFGLSALARPAGLVALMIATMALPFIGGPRKRRWFLAFAMVAGAVATLLPWVLRNAIRYRELIVVNDAAGINFWRGSHPEMDRISRIKDPVEYRDAAVAFETNVAAAAARKIEAAAGGPRERSRAWFAAGLENVRRNPRAAFAFAVRRAGRFWCPWLNPQEYPAGVVALSGILNIALFSLGSIGLALYRKRDPFVTGWVIALFVGVWLAHVPNQVVMRFRIPFTDPLLIAFAAGAVVTLIQLWTPPRVTSLPPTMS